MMNWAINWVLSSPFWRMLCIWAIAGALGYLAARPLKRRRISPLAAGDAGACAAGIYAGLHLAYGAMYPGCIVHVEDVTGRVFELTTLRVLPINGPQPALDFYFGEFHRVHILIGGIITASASAGGYWRYCTERDEQPGAIEHAGPDAPHVAAQVPGHSKTAQYTPRAPQQRKNNPKKKGTAKGRRRR